MNKYSIAGQPIVVAKQKSKKKKTPKNAFSFYLDEAYVELRQKGANVAHKSEVVGLIKDKWKNMSAEERAVYERKAKQWKQANRQQDRPGRLDCTGAPIDSRISVEQANEERRREARKLHEARWPPGKGVCEIPFYFISFQSLFEMPDEEGYQPVEVACVEFSLNKGIVRTWHRFIDPGPIKVGLRAEVKLFAEQSHQIPAEHFEQASDNYLVLWNELLTFVNPDRKAGDYPPIYTKITEFRKTVFCLNWLSGKAYVSNQLSKVFEIEILTADLYVHGDMLRPSLSLIEDGCSSHMYDHEANTSCEYHDMLECTHCSLLIVKKCCYWIGDSLSRIYEFEITDQHLPIQSTPSYRYTQPELIKVDYKPRSHQGAQNYLSLLEERKEHYSDSLGTFPARDVRYRPQFDVARARGECLQLTDTGDERSSSPESTLISEESNLADDVSEDKSSIGSGKPPPTELSRRPLSTSTYSQQFSKTLAANFDKKLSGIGRGDFVRAGNSSIKPERKYDPLNK